MKTFFLLVASVTASLTSWAGLLPATSSDYLPAYFKTGTLTFEDRVWAQTQIERIYYNHRIWPKENPQPKPPFETMVPASIIEAKVTDSLKKSAALDKFWQHPVTGEMLQAELDRMAKQTHDPTTLNELFAALHNDPRLIAETLARETLSDRLIRNWYAYDTRFHAEARAKAEAAAARAREADWKKLGGEYLHQIIILSINPEKNLVQRQTTDEIRVDAEVFRGLQNHYSHSAKNNKYIPEEAHNQFVLTREVIAAYNRIEIEALFFPKVQFSYWWDLKKKGPEIETSVAQSLAKADALALPSIATSTGCNEWSLSANLYVSPYARMYHTAVWTGSEMLVWGGKYVNGGSTIYFNDGARYDPATDTWQPISISVNAPTARENHVAVWTGTEMLVWGGDSGTSSFFNTGGRYNPAAASWLPISIGLNVPSARKNTKAVWTGSEMIVWGGQNAGGYLNTGARYSPVNDSWQPTSVSSGTPSARVRHTAVWTGLELIIWGGTDNNFFNTGGRYSPATDTWSATSTGNNAPSPRADHVAVWSGTQMIVWSGNANSSNFITGGRYDPTSDTWLTTSVAANTPSSRVNPTAIWTGSIMIIWGGDELSLQNTGGRYDPVADTWLPTSTGANVPAGRQFHTAIWTGIEMIVWGGFVDITGIGNSGGRYNPVTDAWLPTFSGSNIPAARAYHTAIWNGSEILLWGGMNYGASNFVYLNSGGRYRPATDSWQAMSTGTNVPTARTEHNAVWTGSEMIVWGGYNNGAVFKTGGRYNPVSDNWLPTSTGLNSPTARTGHNAAWSGLVMIVWGGSNNGSSYVNTGGRYNPLNDTWVPTSVGANVPAARGSTSSVWTGTEMIIWGGYKLVCAPSCGYVTYNDGGRYNPVNDIWAPTSTGANVPVGRYNHVSVWTGSEMLIWGGQINDATVLYSGGRYNPASDSWSATNMGANLPSGTLTESAVWTGDEMITWGGTGSAGYGNTGGRYNPNNDGWLTTSTDINVPSSRGSHTAIWTGSRMIVWGGTSNSFSVYMNTGGVYKSGTAASPGNSLRTGKSSSIDLSWLNSSGANTYNVKRCDSSASSCIPSAIVANPTTNQYSEPDDGISHFYAVEAVNACGATP